VSAVTHNESAQMGSPVSCYGCENNGNEWSNREYWHEDLHCTTCHEDGHRACSQCGACLPKRHRWDRFYCSSTCRVRAHAERFRASIERVEWETQYPEQAAKERAEQEAIVREIRALNGADEPGAERRKRREALKAVADRCADCERPFERDETIYRRGQHGMDGPVLPYCSAHRCAQSDGRHNKDLPEGRSYQNCRCPGKAGDSKWRKPEPCAGCGRMVANDRATADPHRFIRDWAYSGERERTARVFCSERCRRIASRTPRRQHGPAPCESCSAEFVPARADARYCSSACRQRAYRERQSEAER
jgi:hypothetical protein